MKYMKNTTNEILSQMFKERNSSKSTQENYKRAVRYFEEHTNKKLPELMHIAETQEKDPAISWKDAYLRNELVSFRTYLYEKYTVTSATTYLNKIIATFRHFGIVIYQLPYFSKKQLAPQPQIFPEDLPNKKILKKCVEVKNPLLKAAVLLMSSSGISRIDLLELTIQDYLVATNEYHSQRDIFLAIEEMEDKQVVPTFNLVRRKTGIPFVTFCSPEAVKAINNYILSRTDNITVYSKLFQITPRHFSKIFTDTNEKLGLGNAGTWGKFTPHALRRYHATQLVEAGMSESKIDLLQGRKPKGVIHQSYIRIKKEVLKEEYINALSFLTVNDIEEVKSELDMVKEEKDKLLVENIELRRQSQRIDDLEKIVLGDIDESKLSKLHKLL